MFCFFQRFINKKKSDRTGFLVHKEKKNCLETSDFFLLHFVYILHTLWCSQFSNGNCDSFLVVYTPKKKNECIEGPQKKKTMQTSLNNRNFKFKIILNNKPKKMRRTKVKSSCSKIDLFQEITCNTFRRRKWQCDNQRFIVFMSLAFELCHIYN